MITWDLTFVLYKSLSHFLCVQHHEHLQGDTDQTSCMINCVLHRCMICVHLQVRTIQDRYKHFRLQRSSDTDQFGFKRLRP